MRDCHDSASGGGKEVFHETGNLALRRGTDPINCSGQVSVYTKCRMKLLAGEATTDRVFQRCAELHRPMLSLAAIFPGFVTSVLT